MAARNAEEEIHTRPLDRKIAKGVLWLSSIVRRRRRLCSRFPRTSFLGTGQISRSELRGARNQLSTQSFFVPIKVGKHLTCPQWVNRPGLLGSGRGKAGTLFVHLVLLLRSRCSESWEASVGRLVTNPAKTGGSEDWDRDTPFGDRSNIEVRDALTSSPLNRSSFRSKWANI
jgi:hypothetical protein